MLMFDKKTEGFHGYRNKNMANQKWKTKLY